MFKGKELEGIVVASRRLRLVEGEAIVPCFSPRCAPNRVSSSAENGHPSVKKAREHIEAHFAEDLPFGTCGFGFFESVLLRPYI